MPKLELPRSLEGGESSVVRGLSAQTLLDVLDYRATNQSTKTAYRFLKDGETEVATLNFQQLERRARAFGAYLSKRGFAGSRALLVLPSSLDFIVAFFGCLYGAVTAVPVPAHPLRNRNLARVQAVMGDAGAAAVITTAALRAKLKTVLETADASGHVDYVLVDDPSENLESDGAWQRPVIDTNTLAFLQYTSGSTGTPKGVMVSHGNILANQEMIRSVYRLTPDDVGVGWLPLFHDMGLIGHVVAPVYAGVTSILMSPMAFLKKPARWLRAISEYGATISGGPNFAYELCARKTTPEDREGLDLSGWRVAYSGAEPVRAATLAGFSRVFKRQGFRHSAHFPCYGMAEATLMVSGGPVDTDARILCLDGEQLEGNKVVRGMPNAPKARELVSCGRPAMGEGGSQEVLIVDPETATPCAANRVGEVWIRGTHVAKGYWNRSEQTEITLRAYRADNGKGPYLRTGDLGFLYKGELVINGRIKDVMVIRGRNIYPQDVEWAVEASHPGLQPGACAAFSIDHDNEEQLVVVQELKPRAKPDFGEIFGIIREVIADAFDLSVYNTVLVKAGTIAKTSSGKIQRSTTRHRYLADEHNVIAHLLGHSAEQLTGDPLEEQEVDARCEPVANATAAADIQQWMVAELAQELKISMAEIDIHQPFSYYGLASVEGITLVGKLEEWLARPVPLSLIWDYPTIHSASQWLGSIRE